jgi:hypothetical protein
MNWEKIDKFYIVLSFVLVVMSVLVIFSFRGIFAALLTAYELDQSQLTAKAQIDTSALEEAGGWITQREKHVLQPVQ